MNSKSINEQSNLNFHLQWNITHHDTNFPGWSRAVGLKYRKNEEWWVPRRLSSRTVTLPVQRGHTEAVRCIWEASKDWWNTMRPFCFCLLGRLPQSWFCFPSCLFNCTLQQKSYKPPKILHHTPELGSQPGWQTAGDSGFLCSQQELEQRLQSLNLSQPVLHAVPPTHLPPHGSQDSAALKKSLYGWGKRKRRAETRQGREIVRTRQKGQAQNSS